MSDQLGNDVVDDTIDVETEQPKSLIGRLSLRSWITILTGLFALIAFTFQLPVWSGRAVPISESRELEFRIADLEFLLQDEKREAAQTDDERRVLQDQLRALTSDLEGLGRTLVEQQSREKELRNELNGLRDTQLNSEATGQAVQELEEANRRAESDLSRALSQINRLRETLEDREANRPDPSQESAWVGVWGGRYFCSSGSRREGLVRWIITSNGGNSFSIDEVAARENPEPNTYQVSRNGSEIRGVSTNGRYQVYAIFKENGTLEGDWPGHSCGQVVLAKLQ